MRFDLQSLPIGSRLILALMTIVGLFMLIAFGFTVTSVYRLARWQPAQAVLTSTIPKTIYRGPQREYVGTTEERRYMFKTKDGSDASFSFHSQFAADKELDILYSPSGGTDIKGVFRDDEWTRRSTAYWWLTGGLVVLLGGLVLCLIGGGIVLTSLRSQSRRRRRRRKYPEDDIED